MIVTRIFRLLLVALSILAAAEALSPRQGAAVGIRGAINVRQDSDRSGDTTTSRTSQASTTTKATPTDDAGTTTPTATPTEDSTSPTQPVTRTTPTNTETKTTPTDNTETTPTATETKTTPTTTPGNGDSKTTSSPTTEAPQTTPTTYTTVVIMTTTNSNGDAQVVTTSSTATGFATLSTNSDSGSNQGMSTSTRNTIIGVVVGVGGAIILAAIGLIWWRVWGRKKNHEENDGLMGYGGYTAGAAEKPESLTGGHTGTMGSNSSRTPFQSTLESYHAPTQVNQASNF